MPRRGVSQDTVAKTLRMLEESALQNIDDFGSQGIANTLHILAKQRNYKPKENLWLALERRAEAISGEFNSQHVANKLWAFTTVEWGENRFSNLEAVAEYPDCVCEAVSGRPTTASRGL